MPGEKIDELTLGVGLTSEEFQAGVDKILGSMEQMRISAGTTAEGMSASLGSIGSSVGGLALKFTGMFLAVRGIEDVVGYFKDLSTHFANLAFESRYLGQSGVELSRFGEVAELAGGSAEDAIAAVQGLQSSIFGLEFRGQMSDNLLMLQRLGVGYLTAGGQMRDMKDVAFETAAALQQQLPGPQNEAFRVQWAAQIFGQGGLANAIGSGLGELRKFWADSGKDQKSITQRLLDSQMTLSQDVTRLGYQVQSSAGAMLGSLTPAIEELIHTIEQELIPEIDSWISEIDQWLHPESYFQQAAKGDMGIMHPINDLAHAGTWVGGKLADFGDLWQRHQAAKKVTIPESIFKEIGPYGENMDDIALMYLQAGGSPAGDNMRLWQQVIHAYEVEYQQYQQAHGGAEPPPGPIPLTPAAPSPRTLSTPNASRPSTSPLGASPAGKPTAANTGPRVHIGQIGPIYSNAKDAKGLVADINRVAERKLLVSQADPGMA